MYIVFNSIYFIIVKVCACVRFKTQITACVGEWGDKNYHCTSYESSLGIFAHSVLNSGVLKLGTSQTQLFNTEDN